MFWRSLEILVERGTMLHVYRISDKMHIDTVD